MKRKEQLEELRKLSLTELKETRLSSEEELMNLKFKRATAQLEKTATIGAIRKKIARINTLIGEKGQE